MSGVTFSRRGEVLLAPLYDAAPTLLLYARSSNARHYVAGQARLNYITLDHLVREGVTVKVRFGVLCNIRYSHACD